MKKMKMLLMILVVVAITSSCLTTKTNVGSYKETEGKEYVYAKGKQMWLFWGTMPIGRTNVNTPKDGNCQIVTKFNVGDALISGLTGGIITSYTIKVNAKK